MRGRVACLLCFNERGKLNRAVVQNLDVGSGSANSHGAHRRIDFHAAGMRHLAGDVKEKVPLVKLIRLELEWP